MNSSDNVEQMKFVFEGENHVDLNLLIKTLSGISNSYRSIIQTINEEAIIDLKVEAFNKGSFEIVLDFLVHSFPNVWQFFQGAPLTIKTFLEILKIKKELKGQKPLLVEKEDNKTKITNYFGETNYHDSNVVNVYFGNPEIDKNISDGIFSVLKDSDKKAVSIINNGEKIDFQKSEYEELATHVVDENLLMEQTQIVESTVRTELLLRKPDLIGESKWGFKYENQFIEASIYDSEFLEKVKDGTIKTLYHGVRIPVEMKITFTLDKSLTPISKKYVILSVTGEPIEPLNDNQLSIES